MELEISKNGHTMLPPADYEGEIQRLQEAVSAERERNLRTLADFKNYRRRIERDGAKVSEEKQREIMLPLLEIIDDMEKAMHWTGAGNDPSVKVMQLIHQKCLTLLEAHNVHPFDSLGKPFDHNLHEAIEMIKHNGTESGTIIDELRRGYLFNDELLRAAQVRVAGW